MRYVTERFQFAFNAHARNARVVGNWDSQVVLVAVLCAAQLCKTPCLHNCVRRDACTFDVATIPFTKHLDRENCTLPQWDEIMGLNYGIKFWN